MKYSQDAYLAAAFFAYMVALLGGAAIINWLKARR